VQEQVPVLHELVGSHAASGTVEASGVHGGCGAKHETDPETQ
jgi:hypothetical protein